ncbi:MAG TPA: hypothetical protein VGR69_00505 [Candidatus Rubrimentiphilum sp.]|nr:hypothetical protein [Candidatus Rubrimentiphilum sp.]
MTSLSSDWIELLRGLNAASAKYLVVGAHALGTYTTPRSTGDLDIWIDRSRGNAEIVYRVLAEFGAPLENVSIDDLQSDDLIFSFGSPPLRIDILTDISGVHFDEAWKARTPGFLGDEPVNYISRELLIVNKRAAGRMKDLADIESLESSIEPR